MLTDQVKVLTDQVKVLTDQVSKKTSELQILEERLVESSRVFAMHENKMAGFKDGPKGSGVRHGDVINSSTMTSRTHMLTTSDTDTSKSGDVTIPATMTSPVVREHGAPKSVGDIESSFLLALDGLKRDFQAQLQHHVVEKAPRHVAEEAGLKRTGEGYRSLLEDSISEVNIRGIWVNIRGVWVNIRGVWVNMRGVWVNIRGVWVNIRGI